MVRKEDIVWLRLAGYPDAMQEVLDNLKGLLTGKAASLKKAEAGDPTFFARAGTFASPGKISQSDIDKAVQDLNAHITQITDTMAVLDAELIAFK